MQTWKHKSCRIKPIRRIQGQCYVQPKQKTVVRKVVREAINRLGWRNLNEIEDSNGGYMFYYEAVGVDDREAAHRSLGDSIHAIVKDIVGTVRKE